MQLDMVLFPGSGALKFSNITDFTTPTLRNKIEQLNSLYVKAEVLEGECGYACSDHAAWYSQNYPTVMPFESNPDDDNKNIHSARDVINEDSNFEHATVFAKLATAYVMELSMSQWRAQ
jgi:leucyl aminopeptidase